jgi:hypothetical protein
MKSFPPAVAFGALAALLFFSFLVDAANMNQGGAIDLRNRITGARLLMHGINPYTYKWNRSEPEEFCDPYNNPRLKVSKTTATPALLVATMPYALFPYRNGQYLWFLTQWALLLGTAWLWWRRCADRPRRLLLGALVTGLTYTAGWRLHAERGQSYVLLLFLFGAWLALTLDPPTRRRTLMAGLVAGLLMTLRPPFALLLPILAWRWRGQLPGAAAGLLLGLCVPLFFSGPIWGDYFSAMQLHSSLYRNAIDPPPGQQMFPPTVENMPTDLLAHYVPIPYADYSVHALLRALDAEPFPSTPILLAGLILFGSWCWALRGRDAGRLLLGLAAWMFLFDLFLPAYRNTYNDVLALDFLALGVIVAPRFYPGLILAALALAAGAAIYLLAPEHDWLIDAPSLLLTLSALTWLFAPRPVLDRTAAGGQNRAC